MVQSWSHAFIPFVGGSITSTSIVLASFLSSLAIGSWLATRPSILTLSPRLVLSLNLLAVGIVGLLSVRLIDLTAFLHSWLYDLGGSELLVVRRLMRGLLIALQVAVPGVSAGLALTSAYRLIYHEELAHHIVKASLLYSAIFLGVLLGVILSAYGLFPHLGILHSTYAAGMTVLMLGLAQGLSHLKAQAAQQTPIPLDLDRPPEWSPSLIVETCSFVGGLAALGLLMAWYRLLSNVFGATSSALSAVTIVFLIGGGLGSLAASRLVHHTRYSSLEGLYLYGMAGLLSIIASAFVNELPVWYAQLYWSLGGSSNFFATPGSQLILAAVVLLPSSFAFGSVLPYLVKVGYTHVEAPSPLVSLVGRMNAWFVFGGISGVLVSGLALVPKIGPAKTLVGLGTAMLLGGFYLAFGLTKVAVARRFKAVAILSSLALVSTLTLPRHNPLLTSHGLFAKMRGYKTIDAFIEDRDAAISRLLFYEEGLNGSVAVVANEENLGRLSLRVNGHLLAGSGAPQRRHLTLLSFLPLVFHPSAREILVLGLGTGISSGQILMNTSLKRVSVIEPEPAMIRAAQWFRFVNQEPLRDPRLRFIQEDPRVHLKFSRQQYDVITGDPSDSMVNGNGPLYTAEFYRDINRHLTPQGVFSQWVQGAGISFESYLSVLKTFSESFGNTFIFIDGDNTILLGTKQNQPVPFSRWQELFGDPAVKAILLRDNLASPEALANLFFGDRTHLNQRLNLAAAAVNTDDHFRTATSVPIDPLAGSGRPIADELVQLLSPGRRENMTLAISGLRLENLAPTQISPTEDLGRVQEEILDAAKNQQADRLIKLLRVVFADPTNQIFYRSGILLGETLLQKARYDEALEVAETMKTEYPAYGSAYHIAAEALIQKNQLARARAVLEEGLFYHPTHQGLTKLYGAISHLPFSGDESPKGH